MSDKPKNIRGLLEPSMDTLCALLSRNLPPDTTDKQLKAIIDQEIFNFEYQFALKPEFYDCVDISIQNAFRKTIMQNLSFDQDFGLIWMMKRNTKIVYSSGEKVEAFLECNKTVNGLISIHKMTGSLTDVDTSGIVLDPVTGLVKSVTIVLICPNYDTDGRVLGTSQRSFTYTRDNWRQWQRAGHKMVSSSKKPGSLETLNLANDSYWSFMPKAKADQLATAETASGTNPTSGIVPSFAITKCTLHAIKDAKLERNPYAKRFVTQGYVHKKYVDDIPENEFEEDWKKQIPDFPEAASPEEVQNFVPTLSEAFVQTSSDEANKQVEEIVKELDHASGLVSNAVKESQILKEANDGVTKDDVLKVFYKYKDVLEKNLELKKKVVAIGKQRGEAESGKVPEAPQLEVKEVKKVSSDDL